MCARLREAAVLEFVNALLKGVDAQVRGCVKYGARCRDPPAVTSTFLRSSLGFSEFRVKRFWRVARSLTGYSLNVYRLRDAWFHLVPSVRRGAAYVVRGGDFFPDVFDCRALECVEYTNENSLYLYLEGGLGGEALRLNVVYVLVKLLKVRPECYETILRAVESVSRGDLSGGVSGLICMFKVLRDYGNVLADIIPVVPRSPSELMLLSPALGSIIAKIKGRKR
jgi:hypothetical protein